MTTHDLEVAKIVDDIKASGGVVIVRYRSGEELISEVQSALDQGRSVAFMPKMRSLRHFFSTDGFILIMSRMIDKLKDAEVIVPPGCYNRRHILAVRPKITVRDSTPVTD